MNISEANQRLESVRDQFLVRFYAWAKLDAHRELSQGFPFIRQIRNLATLRFLGFVERLEERERSVFCSALLKRAHQRAVELEQSHLSEEEGALLHQYSQWNDAQVWELETQTRRVNRTRLRKILSKRLSPVFGVPNAVMSHPETSVYEAQIRCWTVRTQIDMGGRRVLGYSHSIAAREFVHLHNNISILGWLGISQADWVYVEEQKQEELADCLARLCTHFLDSAEHLLEGLSHNLPEPEVRAWREPVTVKGHRKNGMTIVALDTSELRKAFRGKGTWDIPTSIIPEQLRATGSHFAIVQDPAFSRESTDLLAVSPTYRHIRVEGLDTRSRLK